MNKKPKKQFNNHTIFKKVLNLEKILFIRIPKITYFNYIS